MLIRVVSHNLILRSRRSRRLEGWALVSAGHSNRYCVARAVAHPSRRSLRSLLRVRSCPAAKVDTVRP